MAENVPQDAAFERSYKEETSFINHKPKTREEREALRDKDKLEKDRLQVGVLDWKGKESELERLTL